MLKKAAVKLCTLLLIVIMLFHCTACGTGGQSTGIIGTANDLAIQAGESITSWTVLAWDNASAWVKQAWNDSSTWVQKAWKNSADWTAINWDAFVL